MRGALGIGGAILVAIAAVVAAVLLISARGESGSDPAKAGEGTNYLEWMPSSARPRSVVWAVGDAADGSSASHKVASMITSAHPDLLVYLGDVYDTGTSLEYDRNYRPLYGGLGSITAPTIGNHEWPNAATGYVPYWTAVRDTPPPFWYAFAVSGWQLISLNSNVPSSTDQFRWLGHLLETTPQYGNCRIAFFHHPVYSTGPHGGVPALQAIFGELRDHATIVLSGHDHDMQRFQPIDGITQLVDGSGGAELYPFTSSDPREAFGDDTHHGALRLLLQQGQARATFVAADRTVLDRSTVSCAK